MIYVKVKAEKRRLIKTMADIQPSNSSLQSQTSPLSISKSVEETASGTTIVPAGTGFNLPAKLRPTLEMLVNALIGKSGQQTKKEKLSLNEASVILGEQTLNSLAGSLSLIGGLRRELKGYRFQGLAFWEHGVATANLAWELARALDYPNPVEAYAAGLIHDLGKIVLEPYVKDAYSQIVELIWKEKLFLWQAEVHVFGLDHAATGAHLCERRKLPKAIAEAVRWHHLPEFATQRIELAALVNLADTLAPQETLGLSGLNHKSIHPPTLKTLSLERSELEPLRQECLNRSQWVWPNP
jgi:putative nucleotidyltransferase with HDIG domain